ncbi:hypothetical protein GCM10010985_36830 [Caballeronia grimmiae]|uniref:Uncharacterized protein n=1 Tax=Caballeronia grimmiae TaxID=1071679 RepID=A0ABQ1RTL6_9BURK|nr:hypothetical protein GCM10010985_36830 [Caballeronia grimmiae]
MKAAERETLEPRCNWRHTELPEGAAKNAAYANNILYPKSSVKCGFALTAFSGDAQGGAVWLWIRGGPGLERVPDTGADGYLIPSRRWRKE